VDAGSSHHLIERRCAMASRFLVPYSTSRGWMQDPLYQLQREIDRVFEDVFSGGTGSSNAGGRSGSMMSAPRIDLRDSEGELRLHADLPGVQPSDLDIRVEGDVLTIRGERKSESERNEQNFHVMERSRRIEVRGGESGAGRPMTAAVSGGAGAGSSPGGGASTRSGASTGQSSGGSASITPKGEAESGGGSGKAESGAPSAGAMAGASGPTAAGGTATKR